MRKIGLVVMVVMIAAVSMNAQEWVELFNGKNLKGLEKLDGSAEYRVENGELIGVSKTGTPNTFMATKEAMIEALDSSDVKLLDNRDKVEWTGESSSPYGVDFAPRKGRIPGAKWIEWYDFMETGDGNEISHFKSPETIRNICAERGLQIDDDIIIYCFKGARASNTCIAMKMAGFKKIRNYYGSWNEWSRDMSLPIDDKVLVA